MTPGPVGLSPVVNGPGKVLGSTFGMGVWAVGAGWRRSGCERRGRLADVGRDEGAGHLRAHGVSTHADLDTVVIC